MALLAVQSSIASPRRLARSLLKYPVTPRGSDLGWMARRERRACPQPPVRSERRSQTTQSALALQVAPLFRLSGVARRLQTAAGMRTPRALERRKIGSNATWLGIFNRLLSGDPVQKTKWPSREQPLCFQRREDRDALLEF